MLLSRKKLSVYYKLYVEHSYTPPTAPTTQSLRAQKVVFKEVAFPQHVSKRDILKLQTNLKK